MLGGRWGVIKNVLVKMVMEKMRLTEPFSFSGKGLKGDGSGGIQLLLSIAIPLVAFYQVCVKYRPLSGFTVQKKREGICTPCPLSGFLHGF